LAGRSWLAALAQLETEALRQRQGLEARFDAWDRDWSASLNRLRDFLAQVNTLLRPYDPLLSANPAPEELTIRLTRAQRDALSLQVAGEAITWMEQNWPAPDENMEAVFALWELGLADS
jgi:hypothetical protein